LKKFKVLGTLKLKTRSYITSVFFMLFKTASPLAVITKTLKNVFGTATAKKDNKKDYRHKLELLELGGIASSCI